MNDDPDRQLNVTKHVTSENFARHRPMRRPTIPLQAGFIMAAVALGASLPPMMRRRHAAEDVMEMPVDPGANSPPPPRTVPWICPPHMRLDATASFIPRFRVAQFAPGPCEICWKPNVRAGRERGIYRCGEHLES